MNTLDLYPFPHCELEKVFYTAVCFFFFPKSQTQFSKSPLYVSAFTDASLLHLVLSSWDVLVRESKDVAVVSDHDFFTSTSLFEGCFLLSERPEDYVYQAND